jgi:hypothetical protein
MKWCILTTESNMKEQGAEFNPNYGLESLGGTCVAHGRVRGYKLNAK